MHIREGTLHESVSLIYYISWYDLWTLCHFDEWRLDPLRMYMIKLGKVFTKIESMLANLSFRLIENEFQRKTLLPIRIHSNDSFSFHA